MNSEGVSRDSLRAFLRKKAIYEIGSAKGCLVILCYLSARGSSSKYSLGRHLRLSKEAISHACEVLERVGLCKIANSDRFPFTKTISLTNHGVEFLKTPIEDLVRFQWGRDVREAVAE